MDLELCDAARLGNVSEIQRLLQAGRNIEACDSSLRMTPLHWAATSGHGEACAALLDNRANLDARDAFGRTPLHLAAKNGHLQVTALLLARGANINARSEIRSTPLHEAAGQGHSDVVELLLKRGADIEAADANGNAPLYWAAVFGQAAACETLLKRGANLHARNKFGRTAFNGACEKGYSRLANLLRASEPPSAKKRWNSLAVYLIVLSGISALLLALIRGPCVPTVEGPTSEHVTTEGVFAPGGFVDIHIEPQVESILGLYRGSVSAQTTNLYWSPQPQSVGEDWGQELWGTRLSSKPIRFDWRVPIPANVALSGEIVRFTLLADIEYPYHTDVGRFTNRFTSINEQLVFEIRDSVLSQEEIICDQRFGGPVLLGILFIAALFGWVLFPFFLLYTLFPGTKRPSERQRSS